MILDYFYDSFCIFQEEIFEQKKCNSIVQQWDHFDNIYIF